MTSSRDFDEVFPFTDFHGGTQHQLAEDIFRAHSVCVSATDVGCRVHAYDELLFMLRVLIDQIQLTLRRDTLFLDVLSYGGMPALLALAMGFRSAQSLEISVESCGLAKKLFSFLQGKGVIAMDSEFAAREGLMQDYFNEEATVVYLFTGDFSESCYLDEGAVIDLLFKLSKRLQSGSYILIITSFLEIDQFYAPVSAPFHKYIRCVYRQLHRHANGRFSYNFWILQRK